MESTSTDLKDQTTTGAIQEPENGHIDIQEDHPESPDHSSHEDDDANEDAPKSTVPLPKRRRVTRACDECRRKKIKCDGKQPCTHCTVYSYDCTYDQPSNRRRNAQPQYIEALETDLKRAKAVIGMILPGVNIDLKDPNLEAKLQAGLIQRRSSAGKSSSARDTTRQSHAHQSGTAAAEGEPQRLESMVKATGNLDIDEQGHWDYHGHSSGLSFIRKMRDQFGADIIGPEGQATPFVKTRPLSNVFDSPKSTLDSPFDLQAQNNDIAELPSKEDAKTLVDNAVNDATALLRVLHLPSFFDSVDRIYDIPNDQYGHHEHTFLPLFYSVLALGSLYSKDFNEIDKAGYETKIDKGFKFFKSSRQLLDIADCRDLTSLQAIIYMILFLQCSAKLATCYSYIGVAVRSALRLGMHRNFTDGFDHIEREGRKRAFWVIRKMDIYVGAYLGLPWTLNDEDIDQEHPAEVDDEYIKADQILPFPQDQVSLTTASNAHAHIMTIMAKIIRRIYPISNTGASQQGPGVKAQGVKGQTYSVSLATIREIEADLQTWMDELPSGLKPGGTSVRPIIYRCQYLLRLAYAHTQMMLYRPFLHYVSTTYKSKDVDQRAYACAVACVSVCRNIVHITSEMKRQKLLIGAYWFTMYTTFFAIMVLMFFILQNPEDPTSHQLYKDALEGKETLAQLAKRSMAADRCTATLATLFEKLPEDLKKGKEMPQKKRRQDPSTSQPDLALRDEDPMFSKPRRAATFPENMRPSTKTSMPYVANAAQQAMSHFGMDYTSSPRSSGGFDSTPGMMTPGSTSTGYARPSSQHQDSFPATPLMGTFSPAPTNTFGPPVTDMSAMMFPNSDPFAYPNQPMTTFENAHSQPSMNRAQQFKRDIDEHTQFGAFSNQHISSPAMNNTFDYNMTTNPTSNGPEDVQLFNNMPMYMMHSSQMPPPSLGNQQTTQHHVYPQQQPPHTPQQHHAYPTQTDTSPHLDSFGLALAPQEFSLGEAEGGEEWANAFMGQGIAFGGVGRMGMGYQGSL